MTVNHKLYLPLQYILIIIVFSLNSYSQSQSPVQNFAPLDSVISSWMSMKVYDGGSIKVRQGQTTLFENNYGSYTDTTALHVASAGKWIAAATIAAYVDEGVIGWNDPVSKFLPEFKGPKAKATLAQLLSHTAGYPDYQPEAARRDDYQSLKEATGHIIDLPEDTLPGQKFKYGGLAMQVAGHVLEIATGRDWESLFQEKIARPLNMKHSHFVPVSTEPGFNPMLAGGFKTCLTDYMNFLQMIMQNGQFEGKQILSKRAIEIIEADQIKGAKVGANEYVEKSKGNTHKAIYGLGVWREELDKSGKASLLASPGWAGAYPWIDRVNNIYGFFIAKVNLSNSVPIGFSSFYQSAKISSVVRSCYSSKKSSTK